MQEPEQEQSANGDGTETCFSERETEALRGIVRDWINEVIVMPPFPEDVMAVITKLQLDDSPQMRALAEDDSMARRARYIPHRSEDALTSY